MTQIGIEATGHLVDFLEESVLAQVLRFGDQGDQL